MRSTRERNDNTERKQEDLISVAVSGGREEKRGIIDEFTAR